MGALPSFAGVTDFLHGPTDGAFRMAILLGLGHNLTSRLLSLGQVVPQPLTGLAETLRFLFQA
jgi:hypothetical protein